MIDLCLLTQKNQTLWGVIGRNIALWQNLWVEVGRFERRSSSARARRLRSAAGSINSGRHILESRCAERCAKDAFSTSFRATLTAKKTRVTIPPRIAGARRALAGFRSGPMQASGAGGR